MKSCGQRIQSAWETTVTETSAESCGQEHSEHPECTGRQVRDKWETNVKSRGQTIQSVVGDKCEIMRARALRASRAYWETSGRQA